MLLSSLLITPILGLILISTNVLQDLFKLSIKQIKVIALSTTIINLIIAEIIFILFDFSSNQFQFVQESYETG